MSLCGRREQEILRQKAPTASVDRKDANRKVSKGLSREQLRHHKMPRTGNGRRRRNWEPWRTAQLRAVQAMNHAQSI